MLNVFIGGCVYGQAVGQLNFSKGIKKVIYLLGLRYWANNISKLCLSKVIGLVSFVGRDQTDSIRCTYSIEVQNGFPLGKLSTVSEVKSFW